MGTWYMICHWATNRSDPQNLLSITLNVLLYYFSSSGLPHQYYIALLGMVVISVLICVAIVTGAQTRLV